MIIAFERARVALNPNGTPTQRFAEWIEEMTRQVNDSIMLSGSGSPEGVITAPPKKLYMDTSGTAGNILYVKQTGTGNTGWILV